ncbi:hypothetical protein INR49_003045, partial [Caranx melampygus]
LFCPPVCVLHLCRAQVCNVTVEDDQTIYRVPPVTASRCDFSWSNATGSEHIVLAHQVGRSAVVRSYNISTLTTSGAQVCNVTVEDDQTIYRVPPVTASGCEQSWSNATGSRHTVLAHHKGGRDDVVRSNNISTLITSQCFDHIIYKCKCFPEDVYHQVNCTTTCNVKPAPLEMNSTGKL